MLRALNPLTKLGVCLVWLSASMLIFDAGFQMVCILLCGGMLIVFNRTSPVLLAALIVPFGLFGFGFLTTSLLFHRESDYALQVAAETAVTSTAVSAGLVLFLRAIACGMISIFLALTTDPGALVRALMVYVRLSPRIAYALFAAMQLVPDLAGELQHMRIARAMKSGRPLTRIPRPRETIGLIVPLLAFAIRRASHTAISLEARGLAPGKRRTVLRRPLFAVRDVLFGAGAALVLLVAAANAV